MGRACPLVLLRKGFGGTDAGAIEKFTIFVKMKKSLGDNINLRTYGQSKN